MHAWHFIQPDKLTRFDPRKPIIVGETLKVDPEKLKMCEYGLHASIKPLDALSYCNWDKPIICRVKLSGKILESNDKLCASERTVLWTADAERVLHEFACWSAEQVLYLFEKEYPSDKRPRLAIEVKRKWLRGEVTNEELAAARDAAWDAAGDAARDATWAAGAAAGAAAWAAAGAAAWAATWAARAAAWAATWAAGDAARDSQNKQLESMLMALNEE